MKIRQKQKNKKEMRKVKICSKEKYMKNGRKKRMKGKDYNSTLQHKRMEKQS